MKTVLTYKLFASFCAFVIWGTWAYYANVEYGTTKQIVASITQGMSSFMITLIMIRAVTFLYSKFSNRILSLFLPAITTVSTAGMGLYIIHYFMGTPEIAKTIAPHYLWRFCFVYLPHIKLGK